MSRVLTVGEMLAAHARLAPDRCGARDGARSLTFAQWNERACRLANALLGLGLAKGDRVAVLAYNCVEWMEIYAGLGKAGLVAVPVNFRLLGEEIRYIVANAQAAALIVQDALVERIEPVRDALEIAPDRLLHFGADAPPAGFRSYEEALARASAAEPGVDVRPGDPLAFMYTSGTTGRPKGAIRTHEGSALIGLTTALDLGFTRDDTALLVMPMCHANSLFFAFTFAYLGGTCHVYDRASFDPEHLLATLAGEHATFTSLVPTHYIMMLGLPEAVKRRYDVTRVTRLMVSSAPARLDTKEAIRAYFRNSRLFELYGSTEAGWVTLLRADEQVAKLGSVGREWSGTGPVRLLDEAGRDVPDGEVGELYSRTPYAFAGYWQLPEATAQAFRGPYCTVGDLARRDADGYYWLVDRKKNMIISGGENVYPSEVEALIAAHPAVKDVAVIGVPDAKWGESVHAVVIAHDGTQVGEAELIEWCRTRIAGYKRPRSVAFIREDEMPRTATGKILHRVLRERFGGEG